ncbi:MAG TPA: DoxX family protein, partial [Thermomicrobiales bacterium]
MAVAKDTGLLVLRVTAGGFIAAHGAQKLFGVMKGPGLQGTTGFMQMLGLRPARAWAAAAGAGEFGGGVLTALGFLNPVGPIGMAAAMAMATQKAHLGKGLFASEGGPELTLLNSAV